MANRLFGGRELFGEGDGDIFNFKVRNDLTVGGDLEVSGNLDIGTLTLDNLQVDGNVGITGTLDVDGLATFNGTVLMTEQLIVSTADVNLTNVLRVEDGSNRVSINKIGADVDFDVLGDGQFSNNLGVSGDLTISGDLVVDSNTLVVDASANSVGIGTTNPSRALDIVSSDTRPLRIETTDTTQNGIIFANNTGSEGDQWQMRFTKVDGGTTGALRINHLNGTFWDAFDLERTGATTGLLTLGVGADECDLEVNGNINSVGSDYQINGTSVINATTLGSAVVDSSLTSVGTLTELDVSAGITSGTGVNVAVCDTIGMVGPILIDQQTTSSLSASIYETFQLNLDNQSTDEFQVYKIFIRGRFNGDGGIPSIRYRFIDNSTFNIAESFAYYNKIIDYDGTTIISGTNSFGTIISATATTGVDRYFNGTFTLWTSTLTSEEFKTNILGQTSVISTNGAAIETCNIASGLTSSAIITARIISIGFIRNNTDNSNLTVRVFRML